jgi:hypothetical protein
MEVNCKVRNRPKTFKELMLSSYFWKPSLSIILGSTLGFIYYYFEGAPSGSNGLGSDPYSSIILGGAMGWFFVNRPCRSC